MQVRIFPSRAQGTVCAPPSKSVAHRALICGALSRRSTIYGLAWSEDISATCDCLRALGATIERIADDAVAIGGLTIADIPDCAVLPCRESGSTLRFLIPIAMISGKTVHFTGSQRLMERPLGIYERISSENGGIFRREGQQITVRGGLRAGDYEVVGNISSQFITGLMLALSLADGESRIRVTEPFESRSYTDITVGVLREFGVLVRCEGNVFVIPGAAAAEEVNYITGATASQDVKDIAGAATSEDAKDTLGGATATSRSRFANLAYTVEGDCSNAAFLEALALLAAEETADRCDNNDGLSGVVTTDACAESETLPLTVTGVPAETSQGDRVYYEMLHEMAAGRKEFDLSDCPDLAPCLFAMAAYCGGAHFTGTARLAIKESDRGAAMAAELACFGAEVTVGDNEVTVACEALHAPARILSGHNDHRIVMALALLCTVTGGVIDGAEAVAKSYPDFFDVIREAGIDCAAE